MHSAGVVGAAQQLSGALCAWCRPLTQVKYNKEGDLLVSCAKNLQPCLWFAEDGKRLGTSWWLTPTPKPVPKAAAGAGRCPPLVISFRRRWR